MLLAPCITHFRQNSQTRPESWLPRLIKREYDIKAYSWDISKTSFCFDVDAAISNDLSIVCAILFVMLAGFNAFFFVQALRARL